MTGIKNSRKLTLAIASILFVYTSTQLAYIDEPFWGHHEFNGVFYGTIARNYHRYGLMETKGAQIKNGPEAAPQNWNYHTHHPSTYPLLLYFWTLIFPFNEVSFRLLSITASLVALWWWIGTHRTNSFKLLAAFSAALLLILTPLLRYYSSLPVFEPLLMPLILIGALGYTKDKLWFTQVMIIAAALLDWPGYWLGLWILLFAVVTKQRRWFWATFFSLALATSLILGHQWLMYGQPMSEFKEIGSRRLSATAQPYTQLQWIKLLLSRTKAFIGVPTLLASICGSLVMIKKEQSLLGLLLAIGLSHIFVFRNITWYHDYMLYHLVPYLLVTVTAFFYTLFKRSTLLAGTVGVLIVTLQLVTTSNFILDLHKIKPHKICVEFGQSQKESEILMKFNGTTEEKKICPPFIDFYGSKPFNRGD